MINKINLYVFARRPEVSIGKTRLKKKIGKSLGANFYYNNLSKLLRKLSSDKRIKITLYVTPDSATLQWPKYIGINIKRRPQGKGELAVKMMNALSDTAEKKLLIGSDIPNITPKIISIAWKKLLKYKIIFGPSNDGGFWLIGVNKYRNTKTLFSNVNWISKNTLKQTIKNVPNKNLITYSDVLEDID